MQNTSIDPSPLMSQPASTAERPLGGAGNEELDVHRYLLALARAWPYLVGAVILGAALGLLVASRSPTLYQSVAKLEIFQPPENNISVATIRTLLTSQTVCGPVVRDASLDRAPYSLTAQTLPTRMGIEEVPGTSFVIVRLQLPDAARATDVLLNLCKRAVEASGDINQEENASRLKILERRREEASRRMNAAGARVIAFLQGPDAARLGQEAMAVGMGLGQSDLAAVLLAVERARRPDSAGTGAASRPASYYAARLELANVQSAFESARRVYTDLSYQYDQLQVAAVARAPVLRIVEAPAGPGDPLPRSRMRLPVLGAAALLLLVAVLVIVREAVAR